MKTSLLSVQGPRTCGLVGHAPRMNVLVTSDAQNAAKREQVLELAEKAVRTAFGASLLVSLLVVYVAIAAASSSERDERRRERGGGFVFGGGFNLFDVFYYMSPRPGVRRVYVDGEGEEEMNFLESIFSFVFGDGNPNEGLQEEQWRLVGTLLKEQQGAVVAEQVAPLLLEPVDASEGEEFMLEVLCRFGGTPEYDKLSGRIVYTFQSAQVTAQLSSLESEASALTSGGEVLQEQLVQFSKAPAAQRALVVMLGLANLVGVGILGAKLGDPLVVRAMARDASGAGLLESAKALMPLLSAYAVSFFAIPFGRNALNERRNAEIEKRNAARARAASSAKGSSPSLRKGLEAASRRKAKRTLRESDVAFTSGRSVTDQLARDDAAAFDRRLRERGGASDKPPR